MNAACPLLPVSTSASCCRWKNRDTETPRVKAEQRAETWCSISTRLHHLLWRYTFTEIHKWTLAGCIFTLTEDSHAPMKTCSAVTLSALKKRLPYSCSLFYPSFLRSYAMNFSYSGQTLQISLEIQHLQVFWTHTSLSSVPHTKMYHSYPFPLKNVKCLTSINSLKGIF